MVNRVTVTFNAAVTIDSGAIQVKQRGTGAVVPIESVHTSLNAQGNTVAVITFSQSALTRGTLRALVDGYYELSILATGVTIGTTILDGGDEQAPGGDFLFGEEQIDKFFALYGDLNGDGLVGMTEFGQFRSTFGKLPTDAGYNPIFDFDGGGIGIADFGKFRSRFGKPILPWEQ